MREGNERSDYAPLECSPDAVGYLYFLGSEDGTMIKVGHSNDTKRMKRLRQHATGDAFGRGGDFQILALVRGTSSNESAIRAYFKDHLVPNLPKRETYFAKPLVPYVAWLRDQYFVSTTEEEFHSQTGQVVIESQAWLPGPGRTSDRVSDSSLLTQMVPWAILPTRRITGDDWFTPPEYIVCIRKALGGEIDLDPASHVIANCLVQAKRFFSIDENGLKFPWSGRVYLNPPFSRWSLFVSKVLEEVERGEMEEIVTLGATRTLTAQYFAPLLRRSDAMCIITGRTGFWGVKVDTPSPTDGHFLLYIGPNVDRFTDAVSVLGPVWRAERDAA